MDGESFEHIRFGGGRYPYSIEKDPSGSLWVGGSSLIGMVAPDSSGSLKYGSIKALLPDSLKDFGNVWNIYCDKRGGVYFNAKDHLFYLKDDTVKVLEPLDHFYQLYHPSGKPLIQDGDNGLFTLSGTKKKRLPLSDTLANGKSIRAVLPAAFGDAGTWIVFTMDQGLYRYNPSDREIGSVDEGEAGKRLKELRKAKIYRAIRLDPNKNPYGAAYAVATKSNGLYLLDPHCKVLIQIGREGGLPAEFIWQLSTDRRGNIWAATDNGIALIHTGLPFTKAPEGDLFQGVLKDVSRRKLSDPDDQEAFPPLFIATSQGLWVWEEQKGRFTSLQGIDAQCFDLYPYTPSKGMSRMIIAAGNLGVLSISASPTDNNTTNDLRTISEMVAYDIAAFEAPGGPGVLVGGRDGLQTLVAPKNEDGTWDDVLSLNKVPADIRSVGWEKKGPDSLSILAGMSSEGLLSVTTDTALEKKKTVRYRPKEGNIPNGEIWIFDASSKGRKKAFIGTVKGLYAIEEGNLVPYCRFGGIFCDGNRRIFRFERKKNGETWIIDGSGGRINHLVPDDSGYRIDSTIFRALDLGSVRAIHPERNRTWIGGDQGLVCYFPDMEVDSGQTWHCRLREVKGMGDSLLFGGTFSEIAEKREISSESKIMQQAPVMEQPEKMIPVLPFSKNRMEFSFAANFPTRQNAVEYSYKLTGFDTAWSKWTDRTRKEYTNLPEGAYTFKVKARNIYLKESTTAEFRFRILPPWYRTWTAYGGYTLAGMGFIWFLLWLNSRRLVAQKQRLEKIVDDRTKEIKEKNAALEEEKKAVEKQKEKVEEQQKETERQRQISEERREKIEEAHQEITQSIDYAQKIQYA
ncbi:MAG: triple tyrosine motif-containing protein, partial [Flavobacteriales bacterium]